MNGATILALALTTFRAAAALKAGTPDGVTRRHSFGFTDTDAFRDELEGMVGQEVQIAGLWRVDRIEIQKIDVPSPR